MFEWGLPLAGLAWPLPFLFWWRARAQVQDAALWMPFARRWQELQSPSNRPRAFAFSALILPLLVWTLLIMASAQPQYVGEPVAQARSGRDVMLVVDLSGSMEATDLSLQGEPANRLQVLKKVMGEFIDRRTGDRLGLVLFGEHAYLQAPLTFDRRTVKQFLDESEIGLAGAKRTAIGDGLAMGLKHLQESSAEKRAVILITDGANNAGQLSPEQATDVAKKLGVTVYSIGVGADEMIVRDMLFGSRRVNPSADLDEPALQAIADATGGRYFRARDEQQMAEIYAAIDQLEPAVSASQWLRPTTPLYFYPLALALFLWGGVALWQFVRSLWIRRREFAA